LVDATSANVSIAAHDSEADDLDHGEKDGLKSTEVDSGTSDLAFDNLDLAVEASAEM
jgi:hypothetical protein